MHVERLGVVEHLPARLAHTVRLAVVSSAVASAATAAAAAATAAATVAAAVAVLPPMAVLG